MGAFDPMARPLPASVLNLRDLGGLRTIDGRVVVHGRLYRSSHFGAVAEADLPLLAALGLRTVIDLRGRDERGAAPNVGFQAGVRDLHLPIEPRGFHQGWSEMGVPDDATVVGLMHEAYRRFVREHHAVYAALFRHLADPASEPLVFHCTAGKDRTGFAAALLQHLLGVPRETIVAEYLLSNERWRPPERAIDITTLLRCRVEYLQTAFDAMADEAGSVDAWLERVLGIDSRRRASLRERWLVEPG